MTKNQQSTIDAPISSERIMSTLREQLSAINATVDRQEASVAAASIAAAAAHTVEVELADLAVAPADMAFEAVAVVRS